MRYSLGGQEYAVSFESRCALAIAYPRERVRLAADSHLAVNDQWQS